MTKEWKIMLVVFVGLFLVSTVSAFTFDNVKGPLIIDQTTSKYGKIQIDNGFGWPIIGNRLAEIELKKNTETCAEDCSAEKEIILHKDGVLIDDVRFMTLQEDGSWIEQGIRSHRFYIQQSVTNVTVDDYEEQCTVVNVPVNPNNASAVGNTSQVKTCSYVKVGSHIEQTPEWVIYNVGTTMPKGTYTIKLEGEKKPSRTVDWQITTQGILLDEWAIWGSNSDAFTYWDFNENTGTTTSNRVDNTLYNLTFTNEGWDTGKISSGFAPNGTETITPGFNSSILSVISVNFWINVSGEANAGRNIMTNGNNNGDGEFIIMQRADGAQGGRLSANFHDSVTDREVNFTPVKNQWYMVTVLANSSDLKMYVNGTEHMSTTLTNWDISKGGDYLVKIFNDLGSTVPLHNATVDEFGMWNRTLTDAEITSLWNNGDGLGYEGVDLDSPEDNYFSPDNSVDFNCTARVAAGVSVINISLWHNGTGTWHRNQTNGVGLNQYAHWNFDVGSGTLIDNEVDGTINNMTITTGGGNTWSHTGSAIIGDGAIFPDGANIWNSNISLEDEFTDEEFTMNVWMNKTANSVGVDVFLKNGNAGQDGEFSMFFNGNRNFGIQVHDGVQKQLNTGDLTLGSWHMITVMINSSNAYMYLDGTEISSTALTSFAFIDEMDLRFFSGDSGVETFDLTVVDELSLWNRTLTQAEINTLYNSGTGIEYGGSESSTGFTTTITEPTLWTCSATDSDNTEIFSLDNFTVSVDPNPPNITIDAPGTVINYGYEGKTEYLNWTITDVGTLNSCWYQSDFGGVFISNTEADNGNQDVYDTEFYGQSFNVTSSIVFDKVKIKLLQNGNVNDATLGLYGTNSTGAPNLSDAKSTLTFDAETLAETATWTEFDMPDVSIDANTQYAFVMNMTGGDASNYIRIRIANPGSWAPGHVWYSSDTGATFAATAGVDWVLEIYKSSGLTNTTLTCGDNNATFTLGNITQNSITLYANDTAGNQNSSTITWNYSIWENSRTANTTLYETARESFSINVTANASLTAASLMLNSNAYSATQSGDTWTATLDLPEGTASTNYYWNFTFGGSQIDSPTTNVSINQTILGLCNATLTAPYVNFTYKDEGTTGFITALVDSSTWTYWLGSGTETKTLNFAETSTTNASHEFCLSPADRPFTTDLTYKYSNTSYPQRTYSLDDTEFTNSTTHTTLWLLGSADGIYSSYNYIESSGAVIEGVVVTIERQVSSVWTTVGQATTGTDGLVTFWVNPNFQHRITGVKSGYITSQVTITPSQSLYTVTMAKTASEAEYNSSISGVTWVMRPAGGTINNVSTNFNVTVTSSDVVLENCKFELLNGTDNSVLASDTTLLNTTYCQPSVTYTPYKGQKLFGRLSLDTADTDGFVVVHSDWKWVTVDSDAVKTWRGIKSFFSGFKELDDFGQDVEGEFSRFVLFFLLVTMFLSAFFYFSGAEANSPGMSFLIVLVIVLMASAGGFLTFDSSSNNLDPIVEQYGFFILYLLFGLGYVFNIMGRENQ